MFFFFFTCWVVPPDSTVFHYFSIPNRLRATRLYKLIVGNRAGAAALYNNTSHAPFTAVAIVVVDDVVISAGRYFHCRRRNLRLDESGRPCMRCEWVTTLSRTPPTHHPSTQPSPSASCRPSASAPGREMSVVCRCPPSNALINVLLIRRDDSERGWADAE